MADEDAQKEILLRIIQINCKYNARWGAQQPIHQCDFNRTICNSFQPPVRI